MKKIIIWFDRFMHLDGVIASLGLFAIFLVAISNIFMRYLFHSPLAWSEEVLQLLLIWVTFLGASALVRYNEHVLIGLLNDNLPKNIARWNEQIFNIGMVLITGVVMLCWGVKLLFFSSFRSTPMLEISYFWIYVALPISAIFIIYHSLARLISYK